MIGDLNALHDFVVGQNDLAVAEIVPAGFEQDALGAGAHDLHPLQLLARAHFRGCDAAHESVGVGDLRHRIGFRHRDNSHLGRRALQVFDKLVAIGLDENFPGLGEERKTAEAKEQEQPESGFDRLHDVSQFRNQHRFSSQAGHAGRYEFVTTPAQHRAKIAPTPPAAWD